MGLQYFLSRVCEQLDSEKHAICVIVPQDDLTDVKRFRLKVMGMKIALSSNFGTLAISELKVILYICAGVLHSNQVAVPGVLFWKAREHAVLLPVRLSVWLRQPPAQVPFLGGHVINALLDDLLNSI